MNDTSCIVLHPMLRLIIMCAFGINHKGQSIEHNNIIIVVYFYRRVIPLWRWYSSTYLDWACGLPTAVYTTGILCTSVNSCVAMAV